MEYYSHNDNEQVADDLPETRGTALRGAFWRSRRMRWLETLEHVLRQLSPGERFVLYILAAIFGLSALVLVSGVNALATVTVPAQGGTLIEGEVGPARFLNPILTLSGPDED